MPKWIRVRITKERGMNLDNAPSDSADLPRISLVTPSFNQAAFLRATLDSVLSQGYPNLQYTVVDGLSTDGSIDLIERYRDRIRATGGRILIEKDCGQTHALNKGAALADGEVLCYLNSDDTLTPGALHRVGKWFRDHPNDVWAVGDCVTIDAEGQPMNKLRADPPADLSQALIRVPSFEMPQPSVFWRRRLMDEVGGFDEALRYIMDFDLWCRLLAAGHRPVKIDAVLSCYRMHGASKTCSQAAGFLREHRVVERRYARHLSLPQRLRLWRMMDYRHRLAVVNQHPDRGALLRALARRPWWAASGLIRTALAQAA
jgi:glycosyltransferase involved in cell wall biosynthesis